MNKKLRNKIIRLCEKLDKVSLIILYKTHANLGLSDAFYAIDQFCTKDQNSIIPCAVSNINQQAIINLFNHN